MNGTRQLLGGYREERRAVCPLAAGQIRWPSNEAQLFITMEYELPDENKQRTMFTKNGAARFRQLILFVFYKCLLTRPTSLLPPTVPP